VSRIGRQELEKRATAVFTKPFSPKELCRVVERVIHEKEHPY